MSLMGAFFLINRRENGGFRGERKFGYPASPKAGYLSIIF
tara:strand:+ start:1919 stop:2038 length:120 start_codon:yes stop_codon:yes gene_type:complete